MNRQLTLITLLFALIFLPLNTKGQSQQSQIKLALQMGSDIGGVVPVKDRPKIANPYPNLRLSFGGRATCPIINNRWNIGLEVAYKAISMDADARVDNQKFNDNGRKQYFTGTVETNMNFTLLEIPVYISYQFSSGKDRLLIGPYFAHIFKNKFISNPKKGFIGSSADEVTSIISDNVKDPNYIEDFDFSSSLRKNDLGILFGYERSIGERIGVGVRISMGITDIFKKDDNFFDYKMIHLRGGIVINYNLFQIKLR